MTSDRVRGRPFVIKDADTRLYYEAMYAVINTSQWPWTSHGRIRFGKPPSRDDELPTPEFLMHTLKTYFNEEAQSAVKARARRVRSRQKKMPVGTHLDFDAWELLSTYSRLQNVTLSQAIRERFADVNLETKDK